MDEDDDDQNNNIGLAFSGGGVRSAAFCSGVLRRLLQKEIQVDYVSCISGGNFTAAAYLDWKYRHDKKDDHKWHYKFFDHMRKKTGYFCDWTNCLKGLCDSIMMILMLFVVNLFIPIIVWGGLSIPVAYLVDFVFGDIMRSGFDCSYSIPQDSSQFTNRNITKCQNEYDHHDPKTREQMTMFVVLAVAFFMLYMLKQLINKLCRIIGFLQLVSGVLFALVFLPWFMQQFTDTIPLWMNFLVLGLSMFFWVGFPPLRDFASLAVIFYIYAYIIKWRVYKSAFTFNYQEYHFYTALLAAGVVLWASPYLGIFTRTATFNFIKWKLQFALFTRESVGRTGCGGITCSDFFPVLSTLCKCSGCTSTSNRALTMANVAVMSPQYISNIVADYWRRTPETLPETMVGLGSKKIEIISEEPGLDRLNCMLRPKHIKLADAMSTAAMITKPPSSFDEKFEPFNELQLILGLAITQSVNTNPPNDDCQCSMLKIAPFVLQSLAGAPIIFLAVVWLADFGFDPIVIEMLVMGVFISYVLIFAGIAMLPTGAKKPWFAESIVRWCHVHLYHVRFLREILKINNVGPLPPALISLSDLGRVEKYGLLPLFKRRMKKIVVVDGSLLTTDARYATQLLKSLQIARELFNCEFIGYNGRDIIAEIHKTYLTNPSGKLPRSYRFQVKYYEKTNGGLVEAGQGDILLIAPRHPSSGFDFPSSLDFTWGEYTRDTDMKLDPRDWGTGPVLNNTEVDRLTFCCCECCHCNAGLWRSLSSKLCQEFPRHSTVNQFFTPSMFSAYHREGYRASIEGDMEGFLSNNIVQTV